MKTHLFRERGGGGPVPVSVCMATHNGERFLAKQLASILRELDKDWELVIADDDSQDETIKIVQGFSDPRIRQFVNNRFHSAARTFEFALQKCSGAVILLSDQDDIWCAGKPATMMRSLAHGDLVQADACLIDEADRVIVPSVFSMQSSGPGLLKNLCWNSYSGNSMGFTRQMLQWALPFPHSIAMHDWWLGLVCEAFGRPVFCRTVVTQWRKHANNATSVGERSPNSLARRLKWRVDLVVNLWRRRTVVRATAPC